MFTTQRRPHLVLLAGCLFLATVLVSLISSAMVMSNNSQWRILLILMQGWPRILVAACFIAALLALAAVLSGE